MATGPRIARATPSGSTTGKPTIRPKKVNGTDVLAAADDASEASKVWSRCIDRAAFHPYVKRKRCAARGLRVVPKGDPLRIAGQSVAGWIAVPLRSLAGGEPISLQFISPTGEKLNLPGAAMGDGAFVIGTLEPGTVWITEGIATGHACHEATKVKNCAAVVACGWPRVRRVARALQAHDSSLQLVLVPDAGQEDEAEKIAAELGCLVVRMPEGSPANFDANDLLLSSGVEALRAVLDKAERPSFVDEQRPEAATTTLPALEETEKNVAIVTDALSTLRASDGYRSRLNILLALHSLHWECGLDIAVQWVTHTGDKTEDWVRAKWDSFRDDYAGDRIAVGTLFFEAKEAGWMGKPPAARTAAVVRPLTDVTELLPPAFSEDQLALEFAKRNAETMRWTPGMGWMCADHERSVWVRDQTLVRYELARRVCRAAARVADTDSEQRRLTSAKTIAATLTLAQADPRIVVPAKAWDSEPMLLNTPHGVVDLRTGEMRPRLPSDLFTQCTAVAPDFEAKPTQFLAFISAVFEQDEEMIGFVQRVIGYCATGDRREQMLFFWHGGGANGKSTLADVVSWALGDHAIKLPATTLMRAKGFDRHPTELAQLRGKRLALSSELEAGQHWNEALVKELTGDEILRARFMRMDFFEFAQRQKHVVIGNNRPRIRGNDPAMARRLVLIPFVAKFEGRKRDKRMLEKLRQEGPAILAWIIEGARDWHETGGLRIPQRVLAAGAEYLGEHDDIAIWLDECTDRDGDDSPASDLYASFRGWKQRRGEHAPSATTWFQDLARQPGIKKVRASSGFRYRGIALTANEQSRVNTQR